MKTFQKLASTLAAFLLLVFVLPGCNKDSDGPYDQFGELKVDDDVPVRTRETTVRSDRRVESVPAPKMFEAPNTPAVSKPQAELRQRGAVQQRVAQRASGRQMIGELNVDD
jgi:hypothetical protein